MSRNRFGRPIAAAMLLTAIHASASHAQDPAAVYRGAANRLIEAALGDSAAYERLATLADRFGHRFSGSASLERAIDWILEEMRSDGLSNVRGEPVMVPHWVRGEESATLVSPQEMDLPMLGLGGSIGTPPEGITAEVLVVGSYEELERRAAQARGKIVLFDAPFTSYGETVQYRSGGALAVEDAAMLQRMQEGGERIAGMAVMAYVVADVPEPLPRAATR